ncbi:MAG: FAD-dependent oxidoreductase, partial [Thermoplasmata archaeon]|nr:FAD-dependent oxidoreductase [Thermoplasmata archaeon]
PVPPVALILGAGYAGLTAAHEVVRRSRGRIDVRLVDRHPVHTLRTELYEVGKLAERATDGSPWLVPIRAALDGASVSFVAGDVTSIDLEKRAVTVGAQEQEFRYLIIALGSEAAYYGVPGASEHSYQVYRFSQAARLADALRSLEASSGSRPTGERPRIVVVGGGSTGTEVAAEIATANWKRIAGKDARRPSVLLVCGALPFLSGLPQGLIRHAEALLRKAGVEIDRGRNVVEVGAKRLRLQDGTEIPFDLCVWATGIRAPELVRSLPVPHGKGGRLKVTPTLELPGYPGLIAIGDCAEIEDPTTGMVVPQTAQAALAEAPVAAQNLVARWAGRDPRPFVYRERGTIVSVGIGKGSGTLRGLTVWGSPAALLKSLIQKEYALLVEHGRKPPGL